MKLRVVYLVLLEFALCLGTLAAEDILLPPPAIPISPTPPDPPSVVSKLLHGQRYVIQAKAKCDVVSSPAGLVAVEEKPGPRDWTAIFSPGGTDYEDRNFGYPFLYALKATGTGRVSVLIVPNGAKDKSEWKVVVLDCSDGKLPIPPKPVDPPIPPIPPKPVDPPIPPVPVPVTSFHVIFVHESGATTPQAQVSVMYGKDVEAYLKKYTTWEEKYAGYRRYDPDTKADNETPTFKALWPAVKPQITTVPCMVVEVNGKADILPFPANQAEAIKVFESYLKGGK